MTDFNKIIEKLNQDYQQTLSANTGVAYSKLSTIFEELGRVLREDLQEKTSGPIKQIIEKLKSGAEISSSEKDQIKLWIVGDAQYYTEMENNFDDWAKELDRLMIEISRYRSESLSEEDVCRLRALLRDGSRVLADMFYFMQQKERVQKFEKSIAQIDPAERQLLTGLLEQKLNSFDF